MFSVPHDALSVGAEEICGHARTVRAQDDEIGAPVVGLGQDFMIDRAETHGGRDALLGIIGLVGDVGDLLFGGKSKLIAEFDPFFLSFRTR